MKSILSYRITFYCLLIYSLIYSQNNGGKITYYQVATKPSLKAGIGTLYFNKKTSLYIFIDDKKQETSIQKIGNGTKIYPSNTIDSIANKPKFVMFYPDTSLFYNNIINDDIETILKDKTSIRWQIKKEYKSIQHYNCRKAEGELYGKKYTAWFTDKIPYKYGPVKINGLPGVILELSDEKNELSIVAKDIQLGNFDKIIATFSKKYDFTKSISREQYDSILKNQIKNIEEKMNADSPQGTPPIKFGDLNCKDCNQN